MTLRNTFYCLNELGDDVAAESSIKLAAETVTLDLLPKLIHDGDFLGVTDDAGTTLQVMHESAHDACWIEIPDPERGGSYGRHLSLDKVITIFGRLPAAFSVQMIDGLAFRSWS